MYLNRVMCVCVVMFVTKSCVGARLSLMTYLRHIKRIKHACLCVSQLFHCRRAAWYWTHLYISIRIFIAWIEIKVLQFIILMEALHITRVLNLLSIYLTLLSLSLSLPLSISLWPPFICIALFRYVNLSFATLLQ